MVPRSPIPTTMHSTSFIVPVQLLPSGNLQVHGMWRRNRDSWRAYLAAAKPSAAQRIGKNCLATLGISAAAKVVEIVSSSRLGPKRPQPTFFRLKDLAVPSRSINGREFHATYYDPNSSSTRRISVDGLHFNAFASLNKTAMVG